MLRFHSDDAIPELERDVARTLALILNGRMDAPEEDVQRPSWLPQDVFEQYVAAFTRTGFAAALNYYRNLDPNWRLSTERERTTIEAPSLFVTGSDDPVRLFMPAQNAEDFFDSLERHVIDGAGHWVHQEEPDRINALLLDHLSRAS